MTWQVWNDPDGTGDVHVVEAVDTPAMDDTRPNPWHVIGDGSCPCQPRVLDRSWTTDRVVIGHQDPIQ